MSFFLALVLPPAVQEADPNQYQAAMDTMNKTPRHLPAGELTVLYIHYICIFINYNIAFDCRRED